MLEQDMNFTSTLSLNFLMVGAKSKGTLAPCLIAGIDSST